MSDSPVEYPYDPRDFPYFEPPYYLNPKLWDVMYGTSGDTLAQNYLILLARETFLACWLADERMAIRLDTWRAHVDLHAIVHDVVDFLDRVTKRYGAAHRKELVRFPRPTISHFQNTFIGDLIPEWYRLQDRLYTTYERASEVMRATQLYVRDELQQPWLWLAARLTYHVFENAWEQALGITMVREPTSPFPVTSPLNDHIYGPFVQPSETVLKTKPGEPLAIAKRRLMAEAHKFIQNLQVAQGPESKTIKKGSLRTDQETNVRRGTGWLYRQLIHREIQNQLARDFHTERAAQGKHGEAFSAACGCVQSVSRGLENAQTLLDRAVYRFS